MERSIRHTEENGFRAPVSPPSLFRILKRDLMAASIDPKGVNAPDFRHATATHLAKAGVAPRTVQNILRHSDIRLLCQKVRRAERRTSGDEDEVT